MLGQDADIVIADVAQPVRDRLRPVGIRFNDDDEKFFQHGDPITLLALAQAALRRKDVRHP